MAQTFQYWAEGTKPPWKGSIWAMRWSDCSPAPRARSRPATTWRNKKMWGFLQGPSNLIWWIHIGLTWINCLFSENGNIIEQKHAGNSRDLATQQRD